MLGLEMKLNYSVHDYAFFFDLDGVLAEIVDSPDDAVINHLTLGFLGKLTILNNNAVAIISGRSLYEIERLTTPLTLHKSGLHGLQMSIMQNQDVSWSGKLDVIRKQLIRMGEQFPGVLVEDKQYCIAVHYRQLPEARIAILNILESLMVLLGHEFALLKGKMVYEIKPAHINKARAVAAFLERPEFKNRIPVYLGDDVTDEDAFILVNSRNGISIKVGTGGETAAKNKFLSVSNVQHWLQEITS